MRLTDKQYDKFWSFLVETFKFTEEQSVAIHRLTPMTQEMFDTIIDRCNELGTVSDNLFFHLLDEYPEFAAVRADKIEDEVAKNGNCKLSPEEREMIDQNLRERLRKAMGKDIL